MSRCIVSLRLFCDCGVTASHTGEHHTYWSAFNQALEMGWRLNATCDVCWCPECGPKKVPHLYPKEKKSADSRSPPRIVRRVSREKQPPKKVHRVR